jgi:intraflagellar transport protein 172
LSKFGLLEAAIEFAADNNSFDFAFELGRFASKEKLAEVHYKYGKYLYILCRPLSYHATAMYLEDEGRFKDAENSFILAGKPREAILMYIHSQDWNSALAIAEAYEPHSVPDVLVGQAKIALTNKENARGEALILRAQRPDLAIKFYKELNQWNDAIRFAKEYMPNKLPEVNSDYEQFLATQGGSGKEEILSSAKMHEFQKDYSQAIDMYLRLSPACSTDIAFLEEQWSYAIKLAVKFVPDRVADVARAAGAKLLAVKRPETAGAMLFAVELYKEAIDAFVSGGLWDQAKDVLKRAPKYTEYLEALYAKNNQRPGSSNPVSSGGPVTEGNLKAYAERGEWEKCIELAAAQVRFLSSTVEHERLAN